MGSHSGYGEIIIVMAVSIVQVRFTLMQSVSIVTKRIPGMKEKSSAKIKRYRVGPPGVKWRKSVIPMIISSCLWPESNSRKVSETVSPILYSMLRTFGICDLVSDIDVSDVGCFLV